MSKKSNKDHRPATKSIRRRHRVEPLKSSKTDEINGAAGDAVAWERRRIAIFVFTSIVLPAVSILIYTRYFQPSSTLKSGVGSRLPDNYVFREGLVKSDVNSEEILEKLWENADVPDNSSRRLFQNPVLAYITPWNWRGYDLAKLFNYKFTHLSPVWYDLKSQGKDLVLEGRHNADARWISELRTRGNALVLPRFVLEALPNELLKKKQRDKAIRVIVNECKEMGYDGVVLESWSRWAAYGILHDDSLRKMALQFVRELGEALHMVRSKNNAERNLQLIYVIGPPHEEKLQDHDFGPEDFKSLRESVDGYSLMTYDYSGSHSPGPNAPVLWIRSTLKLLLGDSDNKSLAQKIFVGLNFYGYDFSLARGGGAQPITGREYITLLDRHKPAIQWQKKSAEHFFIYADDQDHQHAVFYPSLMSIWTRLEEALSWGVSVSIWEIGQGLDFFYDLL